MKHIKLASTIIGSLLGFALVASADAAPAPDNTWEQNGPSANVNSRGYKLNVLFQTHNGKCYSSVDITRNDPVDPVWYSSSEIYVDMVKVGEDAPYSDGNHTGYGGPTSASWDNVTLNALANGKVLLIKADGKNYIFGLKNSSRSLKSASVKGCNR